MHPSTLLAFLTSIAAIGGSFCWSAFQRNAPQSKLANPSAEGMAASLLPEISNGTVADGPTGTLQRQVQKLEEQNQLLQKENQDLRTSLAKELEAKTPPPNPTELAQEVATLRELKFTTAPKFTTKPLLEIQQKMMDDAAAQISPERAAARSKAWQAMGFIVDTFDYREGMSHLISTQITTYYDAAAQEVVYQDDADLRRKDGRDLLVAGAHRALIAQAFPSTHPVPLDSDQDDAAMALRALVWGDNTLNRIRWSLQDTMIDLSDNSPPPAAASQSHTPALFTEQYRFCADYGKDFMQTLQQEDLAAMNQVYQRPPQSTAEIIHPELYLAKPPFEPLPLKLADPKANGSDPYFQNVAGEFMIEKLMLGKVSADLSTRIADGWAGDRYFVYAGEAAQGDHALWFTAWRTPADGQEFYEGLRRMLPKRYAIPFQKEHEQGNAFIINDPNRYIRIRLSEDKLRVTLVNATERTMADALETKQAN